MPNIEAVALQALSNTTFDTYWLDSLPGEASQPALELDIECDLLVVGGGFCGLWGAIQAREQHPQRNVVLIEARSIANGASGRPAANATASTAI
jgi:NADPH-dependent 2,4-dienoyl-CoA reductase/sulfur reductase-like enzyme